MVSRAGTAAYGRAQLTAPHAAVLDVGQDTEHPLLSPDDFVHFPVEVSHHLIHRGLALENLLQLPDVIILKDAVHPLVLFHLHLLGSIWMLLHPGVLLFLILLLEILEL